MNRNVIGVAFDAELAGSNGEDRGDPVERWHSRGPQRRRSAIEKSKLAQADDEPFSLSMQGDRMGRDLVLQGFLQFFLQDGKVGFVVRSWIGRVCHWE